jgi:protein gp37
VSKSSIEWTDVTWNPVRGCSRVSPGCVNCYAERMAARNLPEMRSPTTGEPFAIMTPSGPHWTGKVELIESKLEEPLHWREPRRVFVNSMSDLFHESLPFESVALVYAAIYSAGRAGRAEHTYQILTKRPARRLAFFAWLAKEAHRCHWLIPDFLSTQFGAGLPAPYYSAWPHPHIWEGVSAEDQPTADERIPLLLQTPAAVRFVSYEPALAAVDFEPYFDGPEDRLSVEVPGWLGGIDWVICGGESGPHARPFDLAWARAARDQCKDAGVAFFMKQVGARPYEEDENALGDGRDTVKCRERKGGDMSEFPEDLRVRQFPALSDSAPLIRRAREERAAHLEAL